MEFIVLFLLVVICVAVLLVGWLVGWLVSTSHMVLTSSSLGMETSIWGYCTKSIDALANNSGASSRRWWVGGIVGKN
jgi:hypothetical protein